MLKASGVDVFSVSNLRFSGGMIFPLAGADTKEEFDASVSFFGNFKSKDLRKIILNTPRHYKFTIVLVDIDGSVVSDSDYSVGEDKLNAKELASVIKQMSREQLLEVDTDLISIYDSYIVIELA